MFICVATGSSELRHETIPSLPLLLFSVHVLVRCLYLLYFTAKKCLPSIPLKLFLFGLETVTIDPNSVIQLSFMINMLHTDPVNSFSSVKRFMFAKHLSQFSICIFLFHKTLVLNLLMGQAQGFFCHPLTFRIKAQKQFLKMYFGFKNRRHNKVFFILTVEK